MFRSLMTYFEVHKERRLRPPRRVMQASTRDYVVIAKSFPCQSTKLLLHHARTNVRVRILSHHPSTPPLHPRVGFFCFGATRTRSSNKRKTKTTTITRNRCGAMAATPQGASRPAPPASARRCPASSASVAAQGPGNFSCLLLF